MTFQKVNPFCYEDSKDFNTKGFEIKGGFREMEVGQRVTLRWGVCGGKGRPGPVPHLARSGPAPVPTRQCATAETPAVTRNAMTLLSVISCHQHHKQAMCLQIETSQRVITDARNSEFFSSTDSAGPGRSDRLGGSSR